MSLTYQAELVLDLHMQLGEGPLWDFNRNLLFFVDIKGKHIHRYDPQNQQHRSYQMDQMPTALAVLEDKNLLVALEDRLVRFVPETGEVTEILKPGIDHHKVRTNDGAAGPDGRYYIGTMDWDEQNPIAVLYRIEADGRVAALLQHQTIANGITWSANHQTMYYIDSPTHRVQAFDFDMAQGTISQARALVTVAKDQGVPDGMTIDMEGHLWVAHNGAGYVARYHHQTGEMLAQVHVPTTQVSSCAFGGPDYRTLYLTTGYNSLNEKQQEKYPHSGGLFAINLSEQGRATFSCALTQ